MMLSMSNMGKEADLLQAIKAEDIRGIARLLAKYNRSSKPKLLGTGKRINVNAQDCDGMSGLHQAALMCSVPIIQLLLDAGAHVDIKDNKGMRPLHYAAWQGKPEPVALLLQYNASVNEQANKGETPLHLACQHGHVLVTSLLLKYHSNILVRNINHKSPLDLACEFGRYQVVELLLQQQVNGRCRSLLSENPQDTADNDRTTCLHLAARNGHVDVIRLLLNAGIDINRSTLRGTALHEAAMHGKLDVVRMLIESGVDVNKPNSYDQTALDIVRSFTTCHAEREMKHLLKEIINAVQARAIRDFDEPSDPNCLPLKEGQQVTVLEQRADGRWRGIVFHPNYTSSSGYFPATVVQLMDRPVGGSHRTGTLKSGTMKKVAPPVVPELSYRNSGSSFSSGYGSQATVDRNSCGSLGTDEPVSPPPNSPNPDACMYGTMPSPTKLSHFCFPDVQSQYTQVIVHAQPGSQPSTPVDNTPGPLGSTSVCHAMLEDQGIDVCPSPGGSSASGTSSRHSMSSVDSGRASGSDKVGSQKSHSKHILVETVHRHSYHSSTSSVSSDDLQIMGSNVAEMILHGLPDGEILSAWLTSLKFEEYCPLFQQAGYDMPTISRMTPEDLTAIGITKPNHRRKLKAEIARLNISDGIPDYKPNSLLEWLHLLRLEEYYETLCDQGYDSVDKVTELTWEDLEEIGIQKLGHQKKITLAIKRVKDISNGIKRSSHVPEPHELTGSCLNTLSRPTTLNNVPPYSYHSQEVAISTTRSRISPTSNDMGLEFKTFQQSPPKEDVFQHYITSRDCDSPSHHGNLYQPNVVTIQVRSTSRGRSLESLDMDDSVSTVMHQPYYTNSDCWYDTVSAWRHNGYDTDSELSVHDHYSYETSGTATLNRPKGMVKPRPIAKITAKTRQSDPEINFDIDDDPKNLKISNQVIDSWSPQHSWSNMNSSQLYGTLRSKRNPPPPPKRTNSIKNERSIEAMKDEAFATCVKGLASRFVMGSTDLPPPPGDTDRSASPALTEDFPPPPSPLSSVIDLTNSSVLSKEETICAKELQGDSPHTRFRQRRKDSADSNISTSSTESNHLPFANENVGTIKQRSAKSLASEASPAASPSNTLRKSNLCSSQASTQMLSSKRGSVGDKKALKESSGRAMEHSGATDVIVDIENMLANLSTQLDAMLEYQLNDA
ncbi:caskin-2-like [Uloborus diversus]|uniref:caskin-2-like n=1 Tax=Uloborus diversus TaxID=327109 RepID=UPI002408FBD6|nr:caskin-2-like [Uloborus diversus]